MKRLGLTTLAVIAFLRAEAMLPPLYETASEIQAILAAPQLGQKLQSGEPIEKIEKTAQGYEISTNKSRIRVEIIYEAQNRPGPAHYKIYFGDPFPL